MLLHSRQSNWRGSPVVECHVDWLSTWHVSHHLCPRSKSSTFGFRRTAWQRAVPVCLAVHRARAGASPPGLGRGSGSTRSPAKRDAGRRLRRRSPWKPALWSPKTEEEPWFRSSVRLHTAGLQSLPPRSSPARPPRCALRSRDRAAVGGDRRPTAGDRGRAAAGDRGTTGGRLRRGGRLQELEGRQAAAGVGRWEAARTAAPGA